MTPRVAEHSEGLGAAESADSAGMIGIGGGNAGDGESGCTDITVSPLYVPCPQGTGTEGQRTIRTDRTCGSWKAGKCREPGGNLEGEGVSEDERDTEVKPEKDRRDRRMTMEEEEDVERGRMMTEATGGGRSIGSGETCKVNRDNRKRRKSRRRCAGQKLTLRHMAVREAEAFRSGRKAGVLGKVGNRRSSKEKYGVVKGDEMKVRVRAGTGTKSRKQERCRMGYREGVRKAEGEPEVPRRKRKIGRPGYWPRRMENDLKQVKVVEEDVGIVGRGRDTEIGKGSGKKSTMGEGQEVKMGSLPHRRVRTRVRDHTSWNQTEGRKVEGDRRAKDSIEAEENSAEGQDRRWRTRIENGMRRADHWWTNAQSRRLGGSESGLLQLRSDGRDGAVQPRDLGREHGLETQRLVEGKRNAELSKVGSEVGSGEIREGSGRADGMEEAAKGMENRNNEKGRNLREVHGDDPMGRTTRRKSSTCSETTNSDLTSRRFGSEGSEVGRCVRNRKSSAESVVGIRNPEVGSRIRNDKGEDWRMTAQELLVQSESANNSSEEKSEIIGKARKFEMPIPPLRSQSDRRVKGEKLGEPETRQQERSGCRSATGWWSIQACEGPKEPRLPTRPKQMRECLEGFRWPELPKRNMTGRNRQTERVRKAMMDDGEYRRSGRGGKGNEAKTPRSTQRNKKSMEGLGKEKVNRKEQSNFQLRAAARSRNALNRRVVREAEGHGTETEESNEPFRGSAEERDGRTGSRNKVAEVYDAQPKTATVFGRRLDPSPERENGKGTANGGVQPRTIPDASAEASIGRSEVTNGRLESEPRKGDEQRTEMLRAGAEATRNAEMKYVGRERVPERKAKVNECRRGMDVGERKLLGGMDREVGQDSEAKQQGTTLTQPNSAGRMRGVQEQIRSGSESSEGKETREEQREEVAMESTRAEQMLKSSAEGVTQAQMIWTRVGGWNVHEERETRRWTEQSSEGIVEPWEMSAGGVDQSPEDPNKSQEVEQLGRAERNGQTELRSDAADLYGNATYELQQHTRVFRNQSRAKTKSSERARGVATENSGAADRKPEVSRRKLRRLDGTVGDVGRRDDRSPEDADKMSGGGTGSETGAEGSDRAPERCRKDAIFGDIRICGGPKAITQPANCSNTREMSGAEGTETECSERVFAKSCEGNRRRALKIAGGANRGLEGSTERDSRLKRSLGDARPKGDRNPEEPEEGREIWPGPGEDVWDFGKDVRDPERPESFSGASLGNRKSQNTIRTSVRDFQTKSKRQEMTMLEQHQRDWKPSRSGISGRTTLRRRADRKIPSQSRAPTERIGDEPKRPDQPEGSGRSRKRRRGMSGSGRRAERNRANPMVRNELQKSEGRGEEPRDSGDKMPEVSETTEMEERKCRGIRDPKSVRAQPERTIPQATQSDVRRQRRRPEQIKGVRLSSLRLREEWKGGKEVVNDPDRSRSRGRAEDRRRPEISRADGEVARADGSTGGQRPEVFRTEVGGRTGGEPEVIGTESK
ncbi:hypothetical protein DFH06DRAFT_1384222 [Mycena polygramma]|nr:hypothetical protein DFH06DRAFT_1384222 [Mycena polygramma]